MTGLDDGHNRDTGGGLSNATIIGGYVITSVVWIFGSKMVLDGLGVDPGGSHVWDSVADVGFVVVTTVVLFVLIRRARSSVRDWQARVADQQRQLEGIVDAVGSGVIIVDLHDRILRVNQSFVDLFGYDAAAIRGNTTEFLTVAGQPDDLQPSTVLATAKEQGRWSGEVLRRAKSGSSMPVHLSVAPITNDSGELVAYAGNYRDLREVQEARGHVEGLGDVIESLSREMDVDQLGRKAVSAAVMVTGADSGGVALLEGTDTARYQWAVGGQLGNMSDQDGGFRADRGLAGRVFDQERPVVIDDYTGIDPPLEVLEEVGIQSGLSCPVMVAGECVGALTLVRLDQTGAFEQRHVPLAEAVARQIGIALQRQQLIDDIKASERRFRQMVETVPDIMYLATYPQLDMQYVSPGVKDLLGFTIEECQEDRTLFWQQMDPADQSRVRREVSAQIDRSDEYVVEYRLAHADGQNTLWFEDRGHVRRNDDGDPAFMAGVLVDITERKRAQERLEYIAYHDVMTGLPNRTLFLETLQQRFEGSDSHGDAGRRRGALFYVDVDRFHLVNDILGHQAGDQLLVEVADRLRSVYGDEAMVARPNGDEFLIYVHDIGPASTGQAHQHRKVDEIADNLLDAMKTPVQLMDQESYVTVSIGISLYPGDADDVDTLIKHAHRAMNQSKERGRSGYCYYAGELAERQQNLLSLNTRLHRALERDEFVVYYQPIIDLREGTLVGVEALLRWESPHQGLVSPGVFIPVAEETGLIVPIGDWVLDEVCDQLHQWKRMGLSLYGAINLSARQLWRDDMIDKISGAIDRHDISPESIEFEITESATMMEPSQVSEVMEKMGSRGIKVSIDDFGTGYSSLERLKHMPVRTLKIDRSFVGGVPANERDANIVTTVVQLASNFRMQSLAEGIETSEQWKFLKALGCPFGQGFYFSRPVPASDIEEMCRTDQVWVLEDDSAQQVAH